MYVKNTNYFIPGTRHHHLSHVQCMDADRPIFFLILGGGHFETNSTIFIRNHLSPFLLSIQQASEACYRQGVAQQKAIKYNIKILISGVPYVSEDNEKKFPHQGPKPAAVFYKGVEHFLADNYPHIPLLNIMALTKEGMASSLDGYHSGTDVNLLKCMLVLNVMKLMLLESKPML